eukprot:640485-Pyramimonas_sp.AAC.1
MRGKTKGGRPRVLHVTDSVDSHDGDVLDQNAGGVRRWGPSPWCESFGPFLVCRPGPSPNDSHIEEGPERL